MPASTIIRRSSYAGEEHALKLDPCRTLGTGRAGHQLAHALRLLDRYTPMSAPDPPRFPSRPEPERLAPRPVPAAHATSEIKDPTAVRPGFLMHACIYCHESWSTKEGDRHYLAGCMSFEKVRSGHRTCAHGFWPAAPGIAGRAVHAGAFDISAGQTDRQTDSISEHSGQSNAMQQPENFLV